MRISNKTLLLLLLTLPQSNQAFTGPTCRSSSSKGRSSSPSPSLTILRSSAEAIVEATDQQQQQQQPADDDWNVSSSSSSSSPSSFEIDTTLIQNNSLVLEQTQMLLGGQLPSKFDKAIALSIMNAWSKTCCPTGAQTAERILERLEEEEEKLQKAQQQQQQQQADPNKTLLELTHYCTVLDGWAKSGHPQSGLQAERILNRLTERAQEEKDSSGNSRFQPTRVALNCMIHAWGRQPDTLDRAESTLRRIIEDDTMEVEVADYNALLFAFARRGDPQKAEALLKEMLDADLRPDIISYNTVLDAWAKSDTHETRGHERAELILKTMQERYDRGDSTIHPDGKSYSTVAAAYMRSAGQSHGLDAIGNVERLLSIAEDRHVVGDVYIYNSLLDAWANLSGDREDAAEKAEEILKTKMEPIGSVSSVSYNTVIKAWKLSNAPDAAKRAEALMNRMVELERQDISLDIQPDVYTFTTVIDCYAKSSVKGASQKAVDLLQRMIQAYKDGNVRVKPNTVTVNCVLDALARSEDPGSALEAEKLLRSFQEPSESYLDKVHLNAVSYTSVMHAYARTDDSSSLDKVEAIFELMEEDYKNGNSESKPTSRAYNVLLNALIQSKQRGAIFEAETIFNKMKASEDPSVNPDVVSYGIMMNGWAKSRNPDALDKVNGLFDDLVNKGGLKPNSHCYGARLAATVNSRRFDGPMEAETILKDMYEEYRSSGNEETKPHIAQITSVIDCWAKSGFPEAGERAEQLLDWMQEICEAHNDESFRPNEMTYNVVINAWAKSKHFDKAKRAKLVLDKMIDLYESGNSEAKPNTFVYTGVMNACAYTIGESSEKLKSFQIATNAFKDLCRSEYGNPNHVTYGVYLTACRNLIPQGDSRANTVGAVFRKCCQDGQVSDLVMQRAQSALTTEQLEHLLSDTDFVVNPDGTVDMDSIPSLWKTNASANISKQKRKRQYHSKPRGAKRP